MSNDTPRCEDGPICDREFAPTKNGNVCIRDGHAAECHETGRLQDGRSVIGPRFCFWQRDDKTIATCREKFDNFGQYAFGDEPHVPCEETPDVEAVPTIYPESRRIPRISPREGSSTEKHWQTIGMGLLPKRDMPVHRLGCSIFRESTSCALAIGNDYAVTLSSIPMNAAETCSPGKLARRG